MAYRNNKRSSVTDTFEGTVGFGIGLLARAFSGDDKARCEHDDRRGVYILAVDGRRLGAINPFDLIHEIEARWGDNPAAADLEMVGSSTEPEIETVGKKASEQDVDL